MKRTRVAILLLPFVFLGALFVLRSYRLDLVHTVVLEGLLERAPEETLPQPIIDAFENARRQALETDRAEVYLEQLFRISRRLEKIQQVDDEHRAGRPDAANPGAMSGFSSLPGRRETGGLHARPNAATTFDTGC